MAASKEDFKSCLDHCSEARSRCGRFFSYKPRDFSFRSNGKDVIFLAPADALGNNVFSVDVFDESHTRKKLCSPEGRRSLTRSEQLLRERMRASGSGITNYKYISSVDSVLANTGTACTLFPCQEDQQVKSFPSLVGALDYQLCPGDTDVLACVYEGDIWLLTSFNDEPIQVTNTKALRPQRKVMAGQSSFILQEEFDRYTGYWWDPTSGKETGTYRILYEEVDETDIEVLHTFNPSSQEVEDYSYPRPGSKNAKSALKCLQLRLESGKFTIEELILAPRFAQYLSKWEYFTRLGWLDNGKNIFVQVLDREQHESQLILIPIESFHKEGEKGATCYTFLLWKETSQYWINIKNTSCFKFFSISDEGLKLMITSEESGYPHLVLLDVAFLLPYDTEDDQAEPVQPIVKIKHVTSGDWNVMESEVWLDDKENVVFFVGNKSSCLEKHLYAVDLSNEGTLPCTDPIQLTPNGYYHDISLSTENRLFVTCYSGRTTPPAVAVYKLSTNPLQSELLFHLSNSTELPLDFVPPIGFTATASTGETLHGAVYLPSGVKEGEKYPTVLYVYGGPEFQVVKNDFSRFLMKLSQWTSCGFVAVMLDNRGSSNRGKKFESYLHHSQYSMGTVEVEDQVIGLEAAAKTVTYIDTSRVAIMGWSYGGYMALQSIAKKPDVFKVAVSGAPVTDYMWYDTGYTERYLGVPPSSIMAYLKSSVILLASRFPNKPGRLLIIHGMNDENVFFTHTSMLLDALIQAGKPYQIQIYNGERHGIRNPTKSLHCDAAVLQFLLCNL